MGCVTVTSRPVHVPAGPMLLAIIVTSVLLTTGTWAWMMAVRLVNAIHRTALALTAIWYVYKHICWSFSKHGALD